jgi:hypothetical protein
METKYFSFQGRKLKLYKLRDDFYALDRDIAAFFEVEKKYLLFAASKNITENKENDIIFLDKTERKNILKETKYPRTAKIFAFNLSAIMTLSFGVNKGPVAHKISIAVVQETTKKIKEMRQIQKLAEKVKKDKNILTKMIVELEIVRKRIAKENTSEYEKINSEVNEKLDAMHLIDKELDLQTEKINKLITACPEPMKSLLFDPAWDNKI